MTDPPYGILKYKKKLLKHDILTDELVMDTVTMFNLYSSDNPVACIACTMELINKWVNAFESNGWIVWEIIYTRPNTYYRGGKNNNNLHQVYIYT